MILHTQCKANGRPSSVLEYQNGPFDHFICTGDFMAGCHPGGVVRIDRQADDGSVADDGLPVSWKVSTGWDNPGDGAGLRKVDFVSVECGGILAGVELGISFDDGAHEYVVEVGMAGKSPGGITVNTRSLCSGTNISLSISGSNQFSIKRAIGIVSELSLGFSFCRSML